MANSSPFFASGASFVIYCEYDILIALLGAGHFLYTALSVWFYNIPFDSFEGPLLVVVPSAIIATLFLGLVPDMEIVENVDKAREFLLETGQETTNENINLLVGRYYDEYRKDWLTKIANILNARQEVPNFENLKHLEDSNK